MWLLFKLYIVKRHKLFIVCAVHSVYNTTTIKIKIAPMRKIGEGVIMTTLLINFYAGNINDTLKAEFMQAVNHETADMTITLLTDSISKLESKIVNKNETYSEEEVQAFESQRDKLVEERTKFEETSEATQEVYDKVVKAMSLRNKDGFGNSKDVVRTVLRVLGSWNNSKLVKYAIIPAFQSPALYEALETIHITSKAGENGNITMSKEVKDAYKKASQELESIIKNTFSLPFATEYTDKTRVKITAEDKKLLNDCYIKGFSNKFDTDDDGVVTFKKRTINTLVKAKKDRKTQEVTYDYSGLASTISNIVIKHYFAD